MSVVMRGSVWRALSRRALSRRSLVLALVLMLQPGLTACSKPPASATPQAAVDTDVPPAQERPANIGPGIKWAPDSPRYQQVRREAWRENSDFTAKVDFGSQRSSRNGLYVVRVVQRPTVLLDGLQSWSVVITTADGKPVQQALINVHGGMPEHGHGLPSKPQVSEAGKPGQYRIDGLQFSMPGWWEVSLYISKDRRDDTATVNVIAG